MRAISCLPLFAGLTVGLGAAQSPFPPKPEGQTILRSKHNEDVTVSFKEPGICETTPGVRSFAGHVHLPPGLFEAQDYPINTFFWFFEARKDPANAPLAIWLNGGPGSSSMIGLLQENGPCLVRNDSMTTELNPWSWNNEVNMLYIDEPNQVGFSYDVPTNVTVLLGPDVITPTDFSQQWPQLNLTTQAGTVSSQNASRTANTTAQAAHSLWHFTQAFFFEFPHYKPHDDRMSLFAESYGGHYGPRFVRFFQEQNERIKNGSLNAHYMHLDTLGIVNGLIDAVIQEEAYITYPYNNTYDIQVFNQSTYNELMHNFTRPGGCKEQLLTCQRQLDKAMRASTAMDPCNITSWCEQPAVEQYMQTGDSGWYDIGHPKADPFPPPYMYGYLDQREVLQAIGSPVNFTSSSPTVFESFALTRDEVHGGFLDAIAHLLDQGIKVHMMYGDRDYACNWVGGERASLAVPYKGAADFGRTGYARFVTDEGAWGGMTRQLGNYSFTRVFQSGHEVPAYQPRVAYDLFMRAIFNRDIPTGHDAVGHGVATAGPLDTWHIKNNAPTRPAPECYLLSPETCTNEVWKKVEAGKVQVKDYFVVGDGDKRA